MRFPLDKLLLARASAARGRPLRRASMLSVAEVPWSSLCQCRACLPVAALERPMRRFGVLRRRLQIGLLGHGAQSAHLRIGGGSSHNTPPDARWTDGRVRRRQAKRAPRVVAFWIFMPYASHTRHGGPGAAVTARRRGAEVCRDITGECDEPEMCTGPHLLGRCRPKPDGFVGPAGKVG